MIELQDFKDLTKIQNHLITKKVNNLVKNNETKFNIMVKSKLWTCVYYYNDSHLLCRKVQTKGFIDKTFKSIKLNIHNN